ncbi:glycosyltransferase [Desulfovibrio sp. OttesenSCG-928-G15]|nr:glycosyltransferase [Desulfovibrio sp. OttesenSCG-928-G15]
MSTKNASPSAKALYENNRLADIFVVRNGREMRMLGPAGAQRELSFLPDEEALFGLSLPDSPAATETHTAGDAAANARQNRLPVCIGSGTGAALDALATMLDRRFGANSWALAVVDKEEDILAASALRKRFADRPGMVFFPSKPGPGTAQGTLDAVIKELTLWQAEQGGLAMTPLINPFYLRIDRDFYNGVKTACEASARTDFWEKTRYPRFTGKEPRILLLTSKYFLMGEIIAACKRLGIPTYLLQVPEDGIGCTDFIEALLTSVLEFKPDFLFTINHLGVDMEGILSGLLEKLRLPLASWFVDNPHLILYHYNNLVSPWTAIFTWDTDNLSSVSADGFEHVCYLPLGVDAHRFVPLGPDHDFPGLPEEWNRNISFVGNSMVEKVLENRKRFPFPPALLDDFKGIAADFSDSEERSSRAFLQKHPDLYAAFSALPDAEIRLTYETMLTWEATLQYRLSCVQGIMGLSPLMVGDKGWKTLLHGDWHYHSELNYYDDLPRFYPCSRINFNCTSKQMKGAVNQRVFDVPATGSFILTDYREQIENLFEPEKEVVLYRTPEEAGALAAEYLADPKRRKAVIKAARKRILAEHTYEHRIRTLIAKMKEFYG